MSFDRLAPWYRLMETAVAGGLLQRCRTAHLSQTQCCRHALVLGEGPGRFLQPLLRANQNLKVTCLDRSERMIQIARQHLHPTELARVTFICEDVRSWRAPVKAFDLMATHFFLDCFRADELSRFLPGLAASATDGAKWLISDFCEPAKGWQRRRARIALFCMYTFFRRVTRISADRLTPPDGLLRKSGFRLSARQVGNFGLIHSDLWERSVA